ncbi:MAG: hypothetical protein Q8P41_30065, partial [Pseudomonadota bacterium]|nr:hypothetical protein [Pseudomonadota bacterium]
MLRSLLPITLALLLAPSVASASPAEPVVGAALPDGASALSRAPDEAARSTRRSKSGSKSSKGEGRKDKGGGESGGSESRGSDTRGSDTRGSSSDSRDTRGSETSSGERSRSDEGRAARSAPYGDDGPATRAEPRASGPAAEGRSGERSVRTFDGARPVSAIPATRQVSAGGPSRASGRPAS